MSTIEQKYKDFTREEILSWVENCEIFFDENLVQDNEFNARFSVYGRLIRYATKKNDELAALRERIEKLEKGVFGMRKCVAENAGIRNEYQDFEEVFEIAQNLLQDIPPLSEVINDRT